MRRWVLLLLPLFLLAGLGGAVWWRYGHGPAPYTQAQQLLARGDVSGALLELRLAVQRNPRDAAAHLRLGQILLLTGDPIAAERELRTARDLGVPNTTVEVPMARAILAQGRFRDLLRQFPSAGRAVAQAAPLLVLRAEAELGLGNTKAAAAATAEAEQMDPRSPDAALASARVAVSRHQFALATTKVDRALALAPRNTDALLLKGQLDNLKGDRVNALKTFDTALAIDPRKLPVRLERANLLILQGKDALARADVAYVLKRQPQSALAVYLDGVLDVRARKYAAGAAQFDRLGGLLGQFPRGYFFLAIARYNLGQGEQAAEAADKFLARDPSNPEAIKLFSRIELASQRTARVIDLLSKAIGTGARDAEMLDLLGQAYAMAGRPVQAIDAFTRAAALAPKNADILTRLAAVRLSIGDAVTATKDLHHAVALAPTDKRMQAQLVSAAINAGALDDAAIALAKLRKAEGDTQTVGNLSALFKLAQLDLPGAEAELRSVIKRYPAAIQPRVNLAKVLILTDHSKEATNVLLQALRRAPANVPALDLAASVLAGSGHNAELVSLLKAAHRAAPANPNVTVRLAAAYQRQGGTAKAITLIEGALKALPGNVTLLATQAQLDLAAGKTAQAQHAYAAILDGNPRDVATRRIVATLMAVTDEKGALDLLKAGLKLLPGNMTLMQTYVGVVTGKHGVDAGETAAARLALDPGNLPNARALRGDVMMRVGRFADAAGAYAQAAALDPSTMLAVRESAALAALGRSEQAAQVLRDWLAQHPTDAIAAEALANLDISARRFFDAEKHLDIVLKSNPQDGAALNNLAWVYQQRDDHRALATAQRAYLISATPQTADTLGWILTSAGDAGRGLPLLRQAAAQIGQDPTVSYHLAVALSKTGHAAEAERILQAILLNGQAFENRSDAQALLAHLTGKG